MANVYRFLKDLGAVTPSESFAVSGGVAAVSQGDMVQWDPTPRYMTNNLLSSGSVFLGVSEEASPAAGIGTSTNPLTGGKLRVKMGGVHKFKSTSGQTYSHRDIVYQGADAQTVSKFGATRAIGLVWLPDGSQVTGPSEVPVLILPNGMQATAPTL